MVPNNIDSILAMDLTERSQQLLHMPEGQWFERKSINVTPKKFAASLVGFANAEGGSVLVGVKDGKPEDLSGQTRKVSKLRQVLTAAHITPPIECDIAECRVTDDAGEKYDLLLFRVSPSEIVHYVPPDRCYMRRGDSTYELKRYEVQELEYERGVNDFEYHVISDESVEVLKTPVLQRFYEATGATRDIEHVLVSRGLLTRDKQVTNAAFLLFADHVVSRFPSASIRVCRFKGETRTVGAQQNLIFDKRTEGSIPEAIDQAIDWIEEVIPRRKALGDSHLFAAVPIIPRLPGMRASSMLSSIALIVTWGIVSVLIFTIIV